MAKKTKKKSSKKKSSKASARARGMATRGAAAAEGFAREARRRARRAAKKVAKKLSATKAPKKKGGRKRKRKAFSTKVQVGRTKARVTCPPGDKLVTFGSARKREDGSKVTEMRATCYRGRILHRPKVTRTA